MKEKIRKLTIDRLGYYYVNLSKDGYTNMKRIQKIPTRTDYEDELWRVFSLFIRQRDSQDGFGRCISCGRMIHWRDGDCGHYYSRRHKCTKYDERNNNLQCKHCNIWNQGNAQGYMIGLKQKYGEGILEELELKKSGTCKYSIGDLKLLIAYYKSKLKENGWEL